MEELTKFVEKEVRQMYGFADTTKAKLEYLSQVLLIPRADLSGAGNHEAEAMCLTIMYRHLDSSQRMDAMAIIRAVPNERLRRTLVMKAIDTTFVNPNWGMWSKTSKEIENDKKFHEIIESYAGKAGVETGSGIFFFQLYKEFKSTGTVSRKSLITLSVVALLFISSTALENNSKELERRTRTSPRPRSSSLFKAIDR